MKKTLEEREKYISSNENDAEINLSKAKSLLEEKCIRVKFANNLAIFNYDISADFSDPVVQESRGIIIDTDSLEVVCWPFRKFGNYGESYADSIDWSTALKK